MREKAYKPLKGLNLTLSTAGHHGRSTPGRKRPDTYALQTSCSVSTLRAAWRQPLEGETVLRLHLLWRGRQRPQVSHGNGRFRRQSQTGPTAAVNGDREGFLKLELSCIVHFNLFLHLSKHSPSTYRSYPQGCFSAEMGSSPVRCDPDPLRMERRGQGG